MKRKPNYHEYIKSTSWLSKHKGWLKASGYRCAAFPWLRLGRVGGRYHRYNIHHTHYKTLGHERLWWDVLPLSDFAHHWVVHGLLSGWKKPSQQQHYPNPLQSAFHCYCRLMMFFPLIAALVIVAMLAIAAYLQFVKP